MGRHARDRRRRGRPRARSRRRQGNDATARFPELAALGESLGSTEAVLDGEIVALDDARRAELRSAAAAHARRVHGNQARKLASERPWCTCASTCCGSTATRVRTCPTRSGGRCSSGSQLGGPTWQTPPGDDRQRRRGARDRDRARARGRRDKRLDSTYQPGRRSDAWRKVKPTAGPGARRRRLAPGQGRLDGRLGSLLVGYHDGPGGDLHYAGRVGSGLDEAKTRRLEALLSPLARDTSPFVRTPKLPDPRWVDPEVVVEVAFHQWTGAGMLRAPRYRGLRDDKAASEVVRET